MLCPHCKKELPDGSKFCQYCGKSLLASKDIEGSPSAHEKKKKGTKTGIIVLISVIALALVLVGTYVGTYCLSKQHAEQGEFRKASQLLVAPFLTKIHDPLLPAYVSAGLLYEDGEFEEAKKSFAELSEDNYLFASEFETESEYQMACNLFLQEKYTDAIDAFRPLAPAGYRDSSEKLAFIEKTVLYNDSLSIIESKEKDVDKYIASFVNISILVKEGFPPAVDGIESVKECLYNEAIKRYHDGDIRSAYRIFGKIEDYKRSNHYRILCKADDIAALCTLLDFEDTKEVIINNLPESFLRGTWMTDDSRLFFTITPEGSCTFNLPSRNTAGRNYGFQSGVYYTYSRDDSETAVNRILKRVDLNNPAIYKHFQFQIRDYDTVSVYCYADGKTYRLYRQ